MGLGEDPASFLYADEKSLAAVCAKVANFGFPVVLERFAPDSAELRLFSSIAKSKGLCITRPYRLRSSRIPLDTHWKKFNTRTPPGGRRFMQRSPKCAERVGPVEFTVVSPDERNVDKHLDEVFRVEGSGRKAKAKSAILSSQWKTRLYTDYGRAAARSDSLRLFFLQIGESVAAAHMTVEYAGHLWGLKIDYDKRASPNVPRVF